MKCVVVDDEQMILDELCTLLRQAGAEVAGAYQDPYAALDGVKAIRPDAVFLDVEMPGMNGMELAARIAGLDVSTQIVFVTAHEQYAIRAFEMSAVYYVLKPITPDKIGKAVTRVERVLRMNQPIGDADHPALVGTPAGSPDRLSVKVNDDYLILRIEDIIYLKSESGKTTLVTRDGSYQSRAGLASWEHWLKGADFIRCHRGYMVNAAYIKKMLHVLGEYRELVLHYCDVNIPVSRQKAGAVKKWMGIG